MTTRPRMTKAEFLAWEARQPERFEFWDGEIFGMVGATAGHNRVILNLASRLKEHLRGSPCQVFIDGMRVEIGERGVLYPDVVVTCDKVGRDDTAIRDAVVVVEVLSPSTLGYDRTGKLAYYRMLPSLQEYVLIDPKGTVEVWRGQWKTAGEALALPSIGLALPVEAVFE